MASFPVRTAIPTQDVRRVASKQRDSGATMAFHASDRVWHIKMEELLTGSWEALMTEASIEERHCSKELTNG